MKQWLNMFFTAGYQKQAWSEAASSTGLREHQREQYQVSADVCGDCRKQRTVKPFVTTYFHLLTPNICTKKTHISILLISCVCKYNIINIRVSILTWRHCFKSSVLDYRDTVYNGNKAISQSGTVCQCTGHRCFSKREEVAVVIAMNLYLRIWTICIFLTNLVKYSSIHS